MYSGELLPWQPVRQDDPRLYQGIVDSQDTSSAMDVASRAVMRLHANAGTQHARNPLTERSGLGAAAAAVPSSGATTATRQLPPASRSQTPRNARNIAPEPRPGEGASTTMGFCRCYVAWASLGSPCRLRMTGRHQERACVCAVGFRGFTPGGLNGSTPKTPRRLGLMGTPQRLNTPAPAPLAGAPPGHAFRGAARGPAARAIAAAV